MQAVLNQSQFIIGHLAISYHQPLARENKCMIRVRLVRQDSLTGAEVLGYDGTHRRMLGTRHGTTAFLTSRGGWPSRGRRQDVGV
jgi:hypothetical protein